MSCIFGTKFLGHVVIFRALKSPEHHHHWPRRILILGAVWANLRTLHFPSLCPLLSKGVSDCISSDYLKITMTLA
jgi:hypothetical protein